jgi:hypothetical protein
MRKEKHIPKQSLINYTELLYKLKLFSIEEKTEIITKITNNRRQDR